MQDLRTFSFYFFFFTIFLAVKFLTYWLHQILCCTVLAYNQWNSFYLRTFQINSSCENSSTTSIYFPAFTSSWIIYTLPFPLGANLDMSFYPILFRVWISKKDIFRNQFYFEFFKVWIVGINLKFLLPLESESTDCLLRYVCDTEDERHN